MSETTLPPGWAWTTIPEIIGHDGVFSDGDWVESKDQDPNGDVRLIQLADIGDGDYRDRSNRFLTSEKANELNCTFLKPGDVLIARMPDPLGRACIFPGDPKTSVTVVDVCVVRTGSSGVDHRWLMHTVNSPDFRAGIASYQSGSTRKRISRRNLAKVELPLPPTAEQHRIVAEIEKQLTRLEAGVAALRRAQARLQRYKAAVLKAACEGRLVRRTQDPTDEPAAVLLERILAERRKKPGFLEKPGFLAAPNTDDLPELPVGWVWATTDQLAAHEPNSITDGPFGSKLKTAHYTEAGPRVIRLQNIGDGKFYDEKAHISQKHFETLRKHEIFAGDLVIAALGPSLPRACIIPEYIGSAIVKADCMRFKPHPELADPRYLLAALNSDVVKRIAAKTVHGIGRPRLNQQEIKSLSIPLPPLAEQQRIVAEVERRLSVVDEVEAALSANLHRAERLRQSILKQAFEGRLVPQDPADGPASVLLARIRAAKAGGKKQGRQLGLPGV